MFLVESGRVQIKLSDTEGDEVVLADLRSGEFFGELVLLDGKPRSADAVIVEDATLAILSRSTFLSLIRSATRNRSAALKRNGPPAPPHG